MKKSIVSNKESTVPSMQEQINKITKPIFTKALNETSKNHVSVGGVGDERHDSYSFYNPHNARYYFKFTKTNFNPKGSGGVGYDRLPLPIINTSEYCAKDFLGCRVVVKKNLVEITNKIDKDRIFKIDGNADNRKMQVAEAVATLEHEAINVLHEFIKVYGGNSNYVCVNMWIPDNKILHDKIVDQIPIKMTFRNDVVKKVYPEPPANVEYSDPAFASNAFRNLGLYDYAPAIAESLNELHTIIDTKFNGLNFLKSNFKCLEDIKKYGNIIKGLSSSDGENFHDWLFEHYSL